MTRRDNDKFGMGSRRTAPVLKIDYALYDKYLAEADWTEDRKREFLDAMWSIIVEFVMLGFEVHPAQQAQNAGGKLSDTSSSLPNSRRDTVESKDIAKADFRKSAGHSVPKAAERIEE